MAVATETRGAKQVRLLSPRSLLRDYSPNRKLLVVLALAVIGAGVVFNWSWLVAVGIAPILLALAPCAVMCALGLCMNKAGGKSCSGETNACAQDNAKKGEP